MSCEQIYFPISSDDKSWVVKCDHENDLADLIRQRRYWVYKNVKVSGAVKPIPAVLAPHFVMTFCEGSETSGSGSNLIEGIHGTSHLFVRRVQNFDPPRTNVVPLNKPVDVMYYDPTGRGTGTKDMPFTSHLELGENATTIAKFLCDAVTKSNDWLEAMNKRKINQPRRLDPSGSTASAPRAFSETVFVHPNGKLPRVVYMGYQADRTDPNDPIPPACNPITGTAEIVGKKLILTVETVTIKAYKKEGK